jgi:hypothetical protein
MRSGDGQKDHAAPGLELGSNLGQDTHPPSLDQSWRLIKQGRPGREV